MKEIIESLVTEALDQLRDSGQLAIPTPAIHVDVTKDKQHGDYATNVALMLAKPAQRKPREIAEMIVQSLKASNHVEKVEIAGPGFINFFMSKLAFYSIVPEILSAKEKFGKNTHGAGKKVLVEFVSSNPTGPLHVGHGRHAAYGAIISDLLEAVGYQVHREYYVNDGGRQMDILAVSVWLRYLENLGERFAFPANAYKGTYVFDLAKAVQEKFGNDFLQPEEKVFDGLPDDEPKGGDKEIFIDAVIARAKELLGSDNFEKIFEVSLQLILKDIREDLEEFGVIYQEWFSEKKFVATDVIDKMFARLKAQGHLYESEGALWFKATEFGDEKDRVLQRSNGQRTYFANDLAYHVYKFERGFDTAIDIFGSDHHGYMPRITAGLKALGIESDRLSYLMVQFVHLFRGGEQVSMSTRSGSFVTLRELRNEVGNDVTRYFYVMRRCEQPVEFDLDLAKSQSNENPVYYIQYAHARICSVFRQLSEKHFHYDQAIGLANLTLLTEPHELQLLATLARYKEVVLTAALQREPHHLTNYLRDLATDFHSYYNGHQFLVEDTNLRNARLSLVSASRQVFVNGLKLLGISTPEVM